MEEDARDPGGGDEEGRKAGVTRKHGEMGRRRDGLKNKKGGGGGSDGSFFSPLRAVLVGVCRSSSCT